MRLWLQEQREHRFEPEVNEHLELGEVAVLGLQPHIRCENLHKWLVWHYVWADQELIDHLRDLGEVLLSDGRKQTRKVGVRLRLIQIGRQRVSLSGIARLTTPQHPTVLVLAALEERCELAHGN